MIRGWLLEPSPCDAESASTKRTITPPYAGKHSAQPSRVSPVRRTERLCRHAMEMPGRYGFHSTRPAPWEAGQCGVERRPPVQGRSELQAHEATVLQCLAVEVREGLGRSPGPCHTSSASFLGTPQGSGRSPGVMPGQLSTFGRQSTADFPAASAAAAHLGAGEAGHQAHRQASDRAVRQPTCSRPGPAQQLVMAAHRWRLETKSRVSRSSVHAAAFRGPDFGNRTGFAPTTKPSNVAVSQSRPFWRPQARCLISPG